MALAYAGNGVTSGCRSVIEGVPMLIPRLEEMVDVPLPQAPPSEALLWESFSRSVLWFTLLSLSGVVALSHRRPCCLYTALLRWLAAVLAPWGALLWRHHVVAIAGVHILVLVEGSVLGMDLARARGVVGASSQFCVVFCCVFGVRLRGVRCNY
jgi:hypothetical protein